ncbi:MAG: hypothetical protein ACK4NO_05325 [Glycocaulis sp.]
MSFACLIASLALQATAAPEPGAVLERDTPYAHAGAGFYVTLPAGWQFVPFEDGSGVVLLNAELDARLEASALEAEAIGVPGLPDDSIDALVLRLDGPGFNPGARTRVPLVVASEGGGAPSRTGDVEALTYTGRSDDRRWSGIAVTRCGADYVLALEAPQSRHDEARAAFETLARSFALELMGGADFPCGGR